MNKTIFNLLLSLFAVLLIVSCKDDEPTLAEQLVGTWNSHIIDYMCTDSDGDTDEIDFDLSDGNCITEDDVEVCITNTIVVNSNGTYTNTSELVINGESDGPSTTDGTWVLDGNNLTLTEIDSGEEVIVDGTVSVAGDLMTQMITSINEDTCSGSIIYKKAS